MSVPGALSRRRCARVVVDEEHDGVLRRVRRFSLDDLLLLRLQRLRRPPRRRAPVRKRKEGHRCDRGDSVFMRGCTLFRHPPLKATKKDL